MESFTNDSGGEEPGLYNLVDKADKTNSPVMTLEEVQRLGGVDPVSIQLDFNESEWLSLNKPEDGPKILEIVKQLKVGDKTITELVGLCPKGRDRAMHLFRGGNIISKTVKVTTGKTRGPNPEKVWIITGSVVASQRTRIYETSVVFSQVKHTFTHSHTHKLHYTHTHTRTHTRAR